MACICACRGSFESALRKGDVQASLAHLEGDPVGVACSHFRLGNTLWHVVADAGHTALMEALAERLAAVWPSHAPALGHRYTAASRNRQQAAHHHHHHHHPTHLQAQREGGGQRPQADAAAGDGDALAQGADAADTSASPPATGGGSGAGIPNFQRRSNPFQRISDGLRGRSSDPSQQPLAAFVSTANVLGLTPLMTACQKGHEGCVKLLLSLGASPWSRDRGNCTALHYAALRDHAACIQAILQHPSSARPPAGMRQSLVRLVDLPNFCGYTPAHFAAAAARPAALGALLAGGGNIAARCWAEGLDWISGPRGSTPLHFAARRGDVEMCKMILSHYLEVLRDTGAVDPRLHTDVRGWRPCQLAAERRRSALVEILSPQTPLTLVFADLDIMRLYKVPKLKALAAAAFQEALLGQINRAEDQVVQRRARLSAMAAAAAVGAADAAGDGAGGGGGGSGTAAGGGSEAGLTRASSLVATVSGAIQSVGRQSLRSVRTLTGRVKGPWLSRKASQEANKQQQGSGSFSPLFADAAIAAAASTAGNRRSVGSDAGTGAANVGVYSASLSNYDNLPARTSVGGNNGMYGAVESGASAYSALLASHNSNHPAGAPLSDAAGAAGSSRPHPSAGGDGTAGDAAVKDVARLSSNGLALLNGAESVTGVVPLKSGTDWPAAISGSITNMAGPTDGGAGDGTGVVVVGVREQLPSLPGGVSPGLPGGVSPVRGTSFEGGRPEGTPPWPGLGAATAACGSISGAVSGYAGSRECGVQPLLPPPALGAGGGTRCAPEPAGTSSAARCDAFPASPPPFASPFALASVQSQRYGPRTPQGGSPPGSIDGRSASGGGDGGYGQPSGRSPPRVYRSSVPLPGLGLQPVDEAGPTKHWEEAAGGGVDSYGCEGPAAEASFGSPILPSGLATRPLLPGEQRTGQATAGQAPCAQPVWGSRLPSGGLESRSGPPAGSPLTYPRSPLTALSRSTAGTTVAASAVADGVVLHRPGGDGGGGSTPPRGSSPPRGASPPRGSSPLRTMAGETVPCSAVGIAVPSGGGEPIGGSPRSPRSATHGLPLPRRSREYGANGGGGLLGSGVVSGIVKNLSRRTGGPSRATSGVATAGVGAAVAAGGGSATATDIMGVLGSDTSEDVCGICFERLAFVHVQPCSHALCAECSREVTRLVEARAPNCPFCRGVVHGFTAG